jgi:hypothetical protein
MNSNNIKTDNMTLMNSEHSVFFSGCDGGHDLMAIDTQRN